ncbi:MAG: hypothetical protein WAN48_07395 [Actinomycetes bacterium]
MLELSSSRVPGIGLLLALLLAPAPLAACSSADVTPSPAPAQASGSPEATVTSAPSMSEATASPLSATSEPQPASSPTPGPSGNPEVLDACVLLTDADLSAALGRPGFSAKEVPASGWVATQCAWNGPGAGLFLSVGTAASIAASGDPAAPDAKAKLAQFKQQAGTTAKDVPAIGDGAVLTPAGIAVFKGDTYLQVTNLGLTEDQLTELARRAVARL